MCFKLFSQNFITYLFLEIDTQQFFHGENHLAEERIGHRGNQCLPGGVYHEGDVRQTGQRGVFHFGKGDDLKTVLLCPAHIIEHHIGFTALGNGNEEGRLNIALHGVTVAVAEKNIVIKMYPVKHREATDSHAVCDVVGGYVGKAGTHHKTVTVMEPAQAIHKAVDGLFLIVIDERLQIIRTLGLAGKAQPLAHLTDKSGGNKILIGNLGNVDFPFPVFNVTDDTGDDTGFNFIKLIGQKIIVRTHGKPPSGESVTY